MTERYTAGCQLVPRGGACAVLHVTSRGFPERPTIAQNYTNLHEAAHYCSPLHLGTGIVRRGAHEGVGVRVPLPPIFVGNFLGGLLDSPERQAVKPS